MATIQSNEVAAGKTSAAGAAAAAAVASAALSALDMILDGLSGDYSIGGALINNTEYTLRKVDGTGKCLHGQVEQAPDAIIGPLNIDKPASEADNYSEWALQSKGARCSESVTMYTLDHGDKKLYICFYLKHGKHLEAGAFIMKEETFTDNDHNGHWKYPDGQATGERMIHYIQKHSPAHGTDSRYCKYCTKGTSATVKHDDLILKFQASKAVQFELLQKGFSD